MKTGYSALWNGKIIRGTGTAGAIGEWQNGQGRLLSRSGLNGADGVWSPIRKRDWIQWMRAVLN